MATITVDLSKRLGKIKPMHAGGQPPVTSSASDTYFHYLTEAGIPYSRLHDVGGAFGQGKYVDIPNIFRNFDADADDPESYDFTFTDLLLEQLINAGVEPYFRLGVTIENAAHVKTYWVHTPKDINKWASICEHIVRHYTKGWANGYHHKITYWEIWGEPDNPPQLWNDTNEAYYELYTVTAKLIKEKHSDVKVGGYGSSGFYSVWDKDADLCEIERKKEAHRVSFFHGFMEYIKKSGAPLDFFSWHDYADVRNVIGMDKWVHEQLVKYGYPNTESHMNEWDPFCEELGTAHHSAEITAILVAAQNGYVDVACIYDMRTANAPYCPFFNPITHKPIHGYYTFVAFNELYKLGTQVELLNDTDGIYALAASNGQKHAMIITNVSGKAQALKIEGVNLEDAKYHVIDNERLLSWSPAVNRIEKNEVLLIEW